MGGGATVWVVLELDSDMTGARIFVEKFELKLPTEAQYSPIFINGREV